MHKTLIITSCIGEKQYHPKNQPVQADFENTASLSTRESELSQYIARAAEMYTGMQHSKFTPQVAIECLDKVSKYIISKKGSCNIWEISNPNVYTTVLPEGYGCKVAKNYAKRYPQSFHRCRATLCKVS